MEIRITDQRIIAAVGQDVGSRETVTFKILMRGHSEDEPETFKVEISSDHDYFFLYRHMIDKYKFEEAKRAQRLKVNFIDYPTMLIKMINNCIKDPQK